MFKKIRKPLRKGFSRKEVPTSLTFDDPTVWYELKYLNLSNCEIATLPKELGALSDLEMLVLSNNGFGASNKFEWHWLRQTAIQNSLRFLDLSKNSLTELPACIGTLSALTELIVCHNSLICLPQSIENLRNLQVLRSSNNNFGASDKFKWHWLRSTAIQNNLRFLDLSKNSLTELPACIGMLSALRGLIVCHNLLTCFPQSIGNLQNLQVLRSSNNNLGASEKLKWHWLRSTSIRNNLRFLDLSKNSLTELPACIGMLSALTELIVCHNSLTCLPQSIKHLRNLQVLRLSNNNFGASDNLKWHWLRSTAIQNNLRFLDLSKNSLTELPACIGMLSALTELIVSHNSLTYLPQSIGNLRNLQVLRSSNNKLLYLPGSIIKSMKKYGKQLKILDVSTNDFFTFNVTVIHELMTLRSLAAKVILKNRLTYRDRDIPLELLEYLEKAVYCLRCENPIFESHIREFLLINPLRVADTTILDREKNVFLSFECYLCWPVCSECLKIFNQWM